MDHNGLPESAEQTQAEIEFYTLIRTQCETVRKGERVDLCKVAIRETERCEELLRALTRHAKRFGPKKLKVA